ncbi:MAG: hypothetical protein MUO97_03720 [Dehalococcoidia bacterium]|nr:hypothetical protein [Dehalococcoidia bacterium]
MAVRAMEIYYLPFLNKKCPRCGGNLFLDEYQHKYEEFCLQCGYYRELDEQKKEEKKWTRKLNNESRKSSRALVTYRVGLTTSETISCAKRD